jgi:hypothetical protein
VQGIFLAEVKRIRRESRARNDFHLAEKCLAPSVRLNIEKAIDKTECGALLEVRRTGAVFDPADRLLYFG